MFVNYSKLAENYRCPKIVGTFSLCPLSPTPMSEGLFYKEGGMMLQQIEYKAISHTFHTLQSSQPSYLRQMFMIQLSCSPRSSSALITLLCPSVTWALKFAIAP